MAFEPSDCSITEPHSSSLLDSLGPWSLGTKSWSLILALIIENFVSSSLISSSACIAVAKKVVSKDLGICNGLDNHTQESRTFSDTWKVSLTLKTHLLFWALVWVHRKMNISHIAFNHADCIRTLSLWVYCFLHYDCCNVSKLTWEVSFSFPSWNLKLSFLQNLRQKKSP